MKKLISIAAVCMSCIANAQTDSLLSLSMNDFSLSAYKQVAAEKSGSNFIFSPLSVNMAMRMAQAGAQGKTLDEMSSVVSRFEPQADVSANVARLMSTFVDEGDYKLKLVNAAWIQQKYSLKSDYVDVVRNKFGAEVRNVDFVKDKNRKKAVVAINKWVSQSTNGMIKQLVSDKTLSCTTRLVLTNAIYFKCNWQSQFRSSSNVTLDFNQIDGGAQKTTYMKQTEQYQYYECADYQIISLPYSTDRFRMVFLMPSTQCFDSIESSLNVDFLKDAMSKMEEEQVSVTIPKFKMETDVDFTALLQQMGVAEAFGNDANFSAMTSKNDLKITQVLHKAVIEVEEKGTEAAAATAVIMGLKSAYMPQLKRFFANHPFIYYIWDSENELMLFAGRYVKVP